MLSRGKGISHQGHPPVFTGSTPRRGIHGEAHAQGSQDDSRDHLGPLAQPRADAWHEDTAAGARFLTGENFVAGNIRERRRELGLSQAELAAKMKVSRSLVGNWEQAKTRVLTNDLEALAAALLTSRAYLVGRPNVVVKMENLIHTDGGVLVDVEHLVRLRDRQEQVMLDAFRAISDGQRVLVLQLTHELAGSG